MVERKRQSLPRTFLPSEITPSATKISDLIKPSDALVRRSVTRTVFSFSSLNSLHLRQSVTVVIVGVVCATVISRRESMGTWVLFSSFVNFASCTV